MSVSPVVKFASTAVDVVDRPTDAIKAELTAVLSAKQELLPVERLASVTLENRAHRLSRDLKFADTGYKRLSLEPLTWRNRNLQGYPVFALYTLSDPEMILRSSRAVGDNPGVAHGDWLAAPVSDLVPKPILDIYRVHQQRLSAGRITSMFQGIIPKEVREDIEAAKPLFREKGDSYNREKENIFIIGEADWVEGTEPSPPKLRRVDPLVVGWDGRDLWLISVFNVTEVERYMIEEFPALEAHTNNMRLPEHK